MPTQLKDFSCRQDALTVFMDYRKEGNKEDLWETAKEYFDPLQILYLSGENCQKTGAELYQFMRNKVQKYEVTLPHSNRFVFCHYLNLNDLSGEWVSSWQERVAGFQSRLPVTEAYQQYHVVCLGYESAENPLMDQKQEVAGLLRRLGTELPDIAHVVYLLYARGFETLARQEQGVSQLLYLLSRVNTSNILFPMQNRSWLKILSYSDYSQAKAEMWAGKIRTLTNWLTEENDPGQLYFLDAVRNPLQGPAELLRDAEMEFASRVDIYPVHIDDFVKTGIFPTSPRVSKIGSDHEIIRKRKEEYFGDLRKKMAESFDLQSVETMVQERMFYKDLKNLKDSMSEKPEEEGSLESRMKASLIGQNEGRAAEEIKKLIDEVCRKIRSRIKKPLEELEEKQVKIQKNRQHAQKELDIAGRFHDIKDCFRNISAETSFRPLAGLYPVYQKNICLIGSECYGKWYIEQYTIEDIGYAYYCADIDPSDITLLKTGDLLDLADEDAERNLLRIL